ncbi:MAG TPA: hypothetical protein ENK78_02705 [Thiothrix sp.]|nr:hypothetical protein [Thiothrix sp.]
MRIIGLTIVSSALFMSSFAYAGGNVFDDRSGKGASGSSFYGGASVGQTFQDNCPTIEANGDYYGASTSCDRNSDDMAWKIYGGYKFMPNFGVEGAYTDFGQYSSTMTEESTGYAATANYEGQAVSVAAVASAPISDKFEVFGKLGVAHWKRDAYTDDNSYVKHKDEGNDLLIGAGANVHINENFGIRGEVEHFDDLDVNLVTIGGTFSSY